MMIRTICTAILLSSVFSPVNAIAQERIIPSSQQQIQLSFAPVVKQTLPAIVNVYTKRTVSTGYRHPFAGDPFFAPFFRGDFFGQRMRKKVDSALGSGVIVEDSGLIVTNAHVIRGAEEITIMLSDGREFAAELVLKDEASDLALLKALEVKEKLPFLELKPSETLEVGDIVLAMGNPFGVGQTVTSGIVSAQGRSSLNVNDFNFFIQTDAAINPGNSGGALVALDGGVVGINTAIYSRDGGSLGIGFAIPSEMVASVLAAAKSGQSGEGGIVRPWLGIGAQDMNTEIAASLGLNAPHGALVKTLHSASPLVTAGVKVGDVILEVNDRRIRGAAEMKFRMATVPIGETARVKLHRQGEEITVNVKAVSPPDIPKRDETTLEGRHALNGAVIANINPAVIVELGLETMNEEEGVVVLKAPRGTYAGRFLSKGDILVEINDREIEDVKDVEKALKKASGAGLSLIVNSGGRLQRIVLR